MLSLRSLLKVKDNSSQNFQWRDSLLLRAIERGDWVILKNCHLCSAAVLDRLNPLLEEGVQIFEIPEA